jgi:RAS protein activator-like 2
MIGAERGIMRGVLTPSSLEKNIFIYNDPTVYSLLNGNKQNGQQSQPNGLQHSHSTSSISSHSNVLIPTTIQHHVVSSSQQQQKRDNYYHVSSLVRNEPKSPSLSSVGGSIRASTLPRNGAITHNPNNDLILNDPNTNVIQIGLDPNSPFTRKSPTPLMKLNGVGGSYSNIRAHHNNSNRQLNGSQLSLLSDRSYHSNQQQQNHHHNHPPQFFNNHHHHPNRNNILSLGIPHNEQVTSTGVYDANMPKELEDFDDLIKYSEVEEQRRQQEQQQQQNGHIHPNLKAKGSNVSIGGHSSGYQSIQTQSQSSSPIELNNNNNGNNPATNGSSIIQQNIEFFNKIQNNNTKNFHKLTKANGKYGYINPKYSVQPQNSALAFKNPLYALQNSNNNGSEGKSSSLTPSSSEERISIDNQNIVNNNNIVSSSSNTLSNGIVDTNSLNSRRMGSSRMPRTNPLIQVSI